LRNRTSPDSWLKIRGRKKSENPPNSVKFCALTPKICYYYYLQLHHATTTIAAQTSTSVPEIMDTPRISLEKASKVLRQS
jgi:hypothetical protein